MAVHDCTVGYSPTLCHIYLGRWIFCCFCFSGIKMFCFSFCFWSGFCSQVDGQVFFVFSFVFRSGFCSQVDGQVFFVLVSFVSNFSFVFVFVFFIMEMRMQLMVAKVNCDQ
jgi:hypothetical protein